MRPLRLLSYLAPSIPEGLFELVADAFRARIGVPVRLAFETSVSGPAPESDPFAQDRADVAFVCSPSYPLLKRAGSPVTLLPAAPVFEDPRAGGRPVYFADVVVREGHPAQTFEKLSGGVWAFNDRYSRSGWQTMLARLVEIGHAGPPETFFSGLLHAGSHLRSLSLVASGSADAASIDSNTLWLSRRRDRDLDRRLRVIETWGPMPIQPVLARAGLDAELRGRLAATLLSLGAEPASRATLAPYGLRGFAAVEEADYAGLLHQAPSLSRLI
ncbi:MAG: phosphate/phosphite/phosphonate ABC transporter substrate-binding protein [Acidobacteriota bacterium]